MTASTSVLESAGFRYTAFPVLYSSSNTRPLLESATDTFRLPADTTRETVVLSWAILLRGCTGSDIIAFRDGNREVTVDFGTDSVNEDAAAAASIEAPIYTALCFTKHALDNPAQVSLQVDLELSSASLTASGSTIPPKQLRTLVGQLCHILASQPTRPNSLVPPFPAAPDSIPQQKDSNHTHTNGTEISSVLSILNPHPTKLEGPELLHNLIRPHGEDGVNAIEFLHSDGRRVSLSYESLHALSDNLSTRIRVALETSSGKRTVPILLPQSSAIYVALLSILKAGGAFVPLNLDAPEERIRFVVGDVDAGAIITSSDFSDKFNWPGAPEVIVFDDRILDQEIATPSEILSTASQPILPTDAAYIMYTSGSTGKPKGVTISHSAATQSLLAHDKHIPRFRRFLQFAAPTFDVSVFDTFFPLIRGCTLVGCDRGRLLADLPKAINELDIDATELTPTVAGALLVERKAVPGLKVLLTIGEMLTRKVVDEFGDGVLHGMYGPTEAAIHCTVASNFRKEDKVGDIGVPLDTVSAFVLAPQTSAGDREAEILPLGWVGELAVGGWQLADGYLNRPDLTNEVFVETAQWGRLYRTGDRARILPSGRIECLGRVSIGQVKLRGQRVELGEIEEAVLKTPSVKSAIASVVDGSLVVFISTSSKTLARDEVKEVCREWLPGFMVPSDIVVYGELPRLASGKVDRKRLEKEYSKRAGNEEADEKPSLTRPEATVARVVERLLKKIPRRASSLVAMGLDSIQAIRLVSQLRVEGLRVDVLDVMKSDTVEGIASAASSPRTTAASSDFARNRYSAVLEEGLLKVPTELVEEIEGIIPCTSLQESMISETARNAAAYCNWILLELPSTADVTLVEAAFRVIIQRNEILRTGFIALDTGFAQVIWKTPRKDQFRLADTVDSDWQITLSEILSPPFTAAFMEDGDGIKKLGIRIHHAVYDGWSWEHILSDFELLLDGHDALLARPQYRDVVNWELTRSSASVENATKFWKSTLEGAGETRLPGFDSHSEVQPGVSVRNLRLSTPLSDLESSARNSGVSPQVLVQSAWAYLLSCYVGKEDIVFGTVASGRTIPIDGIEHIMGPTILTLPVRVQVGLHTDVNSLLQEIHAFNRKLLEHTELGLREVRKECRVDGFFDSLIVWQQTANENRSGALKVIENKDKLEFSLLLEVEPVGDSIQLRATYKDEILPPDQVSLLMQQMDSLIRGIVSDTRRSFRSLVTDLKTEELLSIANPHPTTVSGSSTRTLATVFEETAAKHPDSIALEMVSDIIDNVAIKVDVTYSQLNASSNMLARELVRRDTLSDELVAICMEKSVSCYISILASVKAGAGYLPLTHETPVERVRQILKNASVKILLSTRDVIERIGDIDGIDMIDVDNLNISMHGFGNLGLQPPAKTLAYAVFTSGSTGVPKGVLVEHEQVVGNLDTLAKLYPTAVGKRMLQFCNIAFDVSVFEIFFTWHQGMVLCSATKDVLLRDMEAAVNAMGVSHLSMTPTVAALIHPDNVPNVEFLVTSGEAVTKKVFNDWADRGLYQGYGPSETTNICTVNPRVEKSHNISNIGAPFENTSAFVVAPDEEELIFLPKGGVGELCFGGAQVCRGYLNMEELTAQKFVVHPEFGKIYRSGDIGRLLANNDIVFTGRQDDQVKIRGNRIELGEINAVLLRDRSAIVDAVTLVVGNDGGAELVSFVFPTTFTSPGFSVVADPNILPTIKTLFLNLAAFVPAYMLPNAIIPLSTIPMTSQGKTDKKLLEKTFLRLDSAVLAMFSEGATEEEDGEWSELERHVADIVAETTHEDAAKVKRNTSIFQLGLDSISAIGLSRRFKAAGLHRLDVSQIMRNPTISALARILGEDTHDGSHNRHTGATALKEFSDEVRGAVLEQLDYPEDQIIKIFPCTPLQEATLSTRKGADPRTYYNHTVYKLKADPQRLKAAWDVVVTTHDIMRTCFAVTSHHQHAFAQVVVKENSLPWAEHEIESETEISGAVEKHIAAVSTAMEITKPPYSFGLFTCSDKAVLVVSLHHSLYDGFAMDLLLEDVRRVYVGADTELAVHASFDAYLEYMECIDLLKADQFWKQLLEGLEPSSFPDLTGKSSMARKSLTGMASQRVSCSMELTAINEGCKKLSTSLLALGQSAWARLLAVYTSESDICFGSVVSGRTIPVDGVETIVAPCFNTVPLRVRISKEATPLSVMETLQKLNAEILPFQLTPLRRIMTALKTEGRTLFDTLFLLQHTHEDNLDDLWEEMEDRGEMDFSIVVELVPNRKLDSLEIVVHFRHDTILEQDVGVLLRQLDSAITSALDNTAGPALEFSAFDSVLLSLANSDPTVLEPSGRGLLHSEFELNAHNFPDRIALEFLEEDGSTTTLTFGQLNGNANRIANHIVSLGVSRDEAIPLCIEKSPLFYTCVLAVLKAGCAFTPIDPSLPAGRRKFMIRELGAKMVLIASNGGVTGPDGLGLQIVSLPNALLKATNYTNPSVPDLSENCLAYRIYTSGSTGVPKAVSIEHRNAVQTFLASKPILPWEDETRLLQFAATTFDMCYYDIFMAWSYGFTLCSAASKYLLGELQETITRMAVSMLDLTPTVAATISAQELPGVKLLYCIGEAMPQGLAAEWEGRCVNSYGPTEAAMCCTITPISSQTKASNIGKPFETTNFVVLSKEGTLVVPVFGSGELCIGGFQVARGYHSNPELTKSRFIILDGKVVYRTGDIVRQLADGTFEFIGRADDQVKIRGLRIELDEINSVLKDSNEGVEDATTIVLKHVSGSKEQLVSFLALEGRKQYNGGPPVVDTSRDRMVGAVRIHAQKILPRYMVPGVILVVDHIPLSAAGKVDKKALTVLFHAQDIGLLSGKPMNNEDEVWTEEEKTIRTVFSEISRVPVEMIHRSSTIYEIGLDSISVSQVASRLKRLGVALSVIDILERPSIELLSALLDEVSRHDEVAEVPSYIPEFQKRFLPIIAAEGNLELDSIAGVFPCTAVQEGMLSQFVRSQGKLYFNHTLLKLSSDIDQAKLEVAWRSVFADLDILRSGFVEVEDGVHSFATVTYQKGSVEMPWVSAIDEAVDDVEGFVEKLKAETSSLVLEKLDLPPWQLFFFRSASGDCYLLFSGHHALYDATSLQIIFQEVAAHYSRSESIERPQFGAVLESIIEHTVNPAAVESDQKFWLEQLEGSGVCRIPNLCPVRIDSTGYHVKELESAWKLSRIESACKERGVSLHAAGQAAWARVLSVYTGETALAMGVVFSGRTGLRDAHDVVFPCLVTLPSMCVLAETSNYQLAVNIQAGNTRALKHQHTPLKSIQRWFEHPEESFFDSIFVYQKTDASGTEALPWTVVGEEASVDYTFSLEIEPTSEDRLLVRATAKDSHVPGQQTELMIRQFEAALVDILENPENSSTDLSNIPAELLSVTPAAVDEIPGDVTLLHKFVEKHQRLCPDKVAFEFVTAIQGDNITRQTWTYDQLDAEGNRIANFLLGLGVTTGRIVAISFEKCPEASFVILGVLKAGCAYVAIDYSAPIDRKAFIVEDSDAFMVLTMDRYVSEFVGAVKVKVVSAESDAGIKAASTATPIVSDLTPDNLSYCLYTSGTTGTPKGCELTHENAVQAMYAFQRLFAPHWDEDSKFFQFASFHFDVSVLELFWSWSVGVCVTSAPRDLVFQDLPGTIDKLQITHLDLTPSLAALLRPEDVPSLCRGVFITGGEALKQDILDVWGETGAIYNGYGPTEVTIGMTMYPRVPANGKPSNIGAQFDNVGTYVFAPGTEKPVPRGALGELCASGKLVGKGYLNRPELTKKAFPVLEKYGEKIYRTGDLVRILYDGTFDFAGRADDQVKLRGQRLEIGEINQVVKKADVVVEAVATLVLRHPKQQKDQLVSFVVLECGERGRPRVLAEGQYSLLISKLVDACRAKLPTYMVPTHFLPLSNMPLSVNNKVDNKSLKAIYQETTLEVLQSLARREDDAGVWSDIEQRLSAVLMDMTKLQNKDVKRSSTIFELGLDSVSVVGLARRLKKSGFAAATPSLIMQNPGLSQMALALAKSSGAMDGEHARLEVARQKVAAFANKNTFGICEGLQLRLENIGRVLPCTSLQEGMIVRFLDSDMPLYFNSFPMVLGPVTDVRVLRKAWQDVAQATDMLRTCFCETPDGYAQVVLRESLILWEEVDITNEDFQGVASRGLLRTANQNKNLHSPPVSVLIIWTPTKCVLSLNIFHALYDGNSLPLILEDVQRAYLGSFTPRPTQFGDVVAHLLSTDLKEAEKFWKVQVQPTQPLQLGPLDNKASGDHCEELTLEFNGDELDGLCRSLQCTPQAIFQAAWAAALSAYGGAVVTLGIVVSGRSLPLDDIEGVVGPTFNTIPASFGVGGASSWETLVKAIHQFNSASLPFHHTPLRLIHKWLRRTSEHPLFDTLFVYQKDAGGDGELERLWEICPGTVVADYPLALEVSQGVSGPVTLTIVAKGELSRAKVMDLLQSVVAGVRSILANPGGKPEIQNAAPSPEALTNRVSHGGVKPLLEKFTWDKRAMVLRKTIAELAEVEESEVGEDSSILELGLDSIEAIKLSSRLRKQGVGISVSSIMRNTTVRKMCGVIDVAVPVAACVDKVAEFEVVVREKLPGLEEEDGVYPTTPLQEAMVAETLTSGYTLYFNHDVLLLEDWVDLERLREAWGAVVENNDILRMSFVSLQEMGLRQSYGQIVHHRAGFHWERVDLLAEDDVQSAIDEAMERTTGQADLLAEPPVYVTILKAPSSTHLILSISHALYDGWSIGLLHEDLRRAYDKSITPRPSPLLMINNIINVDTDESKRYWQQTLNGAVPSRFPSKLTATADPAQTYRAERVSLVAFGEAQEFCKKVGATIQSLGQTCWALLLAHYMGETDVVFGSVLAGRDFDEADQIMFPAMNTVPVRAILHGSYREMLSYMQDNGALTLKHQHAPLREIQRLVDTGGAKLFDTIFLYQRTQPALAGGGKSLYKSVGGSSDVEYNIAVEMERNGEIITWRNACKSTVLDSREANKVLELLDSLLSHVVRNPEHATIDFGADGLVIGNLPVIRSRALPIFNGVRVDLDDVVAAVKGISDDVEGCAAIIVNENGRTLLVVFVSGDQAEDAIPTVVAQSKRVLPHWSLPSYVVKVNIVHSDRGALEAIFTSLSARDREKYSTERRDDEWSLMESRIRKVLAKVSGLPEEEVQRTQTIFHLGLDSISAIRLASDLRKEAISLGVADILREATVERMAVAALLRDYDAISEIAVDVDEVLSKAVAGLDACHADIPAEYVETVYPATAGQIYMLDAWKNSNRELFMPTFMFKCTRIEVSKIRYAWETLVREEPILRVTFRATQDEKRPFIQVILKSPPSQFSSMESSQTLDPAFLRFIKTQEQQKPVDMDIPPVRLCVQNSPTETILFLTIHHSLYDGVSLPLMLSKLRRLLEKRTVRLPTPDPDHPKFAEYLVLLHRQDVGRQQRFWTHYLEGAKSSLAPVSPEDVTPATATRAEVFCPAAMKFAGLMEARCRGEGITMQAVFLAAFAKAFNVRILGGSGDEVVFGIYLANRNLPIPELPDMMAPTLNIVPLRVRGLLKTSIIELARSVQADLITIGDPENAVVNLRQIQRWTGIEVDCFFNFLKMAPGEGPGPTRVGGKNVVIEEMKMEDVPAVPRQKVARQRQEDKKREATKLYQGLWSKFWSGYRTFNPLLKMLQFMVVFMRSSGGGGRVLRVHGQGSGRGSEESSVAAIRAKQFKSLLGQLRSKYAVFTPILKVVQFAIKFLWRSSGDSSSKLGKAGRADTWIRTNFDIEVAVRGDSVDVGAFSGAGFVGREELEGLIKDVCSTALGV